MIKLAQIELTDAGAKWVGKQKVAILLRSHYLRCKLSQPVDLGRTFDLLGLMLYIVDIEMSPPWTVYVAPAGFRGKWIATKFRLLRVLGVAAYNLCLVLRIWGFMDWPVGLVPSWRNLKWPWRKQGE